MRILTVSNLYPPNVVGGYERLCFEVSAALAAMGHDITVLTSRYGGAVADYPGQRILRELDLLAGAMIYHAYPGTPQEREALNARNLEAVRRTLASARPDVVFAWNLFFLDAGVLQALEASGVRVVAMLTDNWLLVMRNPQFWTDFHARHVMGGVPFTPPPQPGRLARLRARLHRPRGIEAVFGAAFVRDLYAASGIRFDRSRVIHNGVRQGSYAAVPPQDRTRLVEPGTLRLLFAGRVVDIKGAHTALEAFPLLDPAALGVRRIQLTILGDMRDQPYVDRLRLMAAGNPDVVFAPEVPEAELPQLLNGHDIYLFPSLYEPFSLTLIHALALGIPTLASRAGGNPEIVRDGETGLLFPTGDAAALAAGVRRLAGDGALRARLAAKGRKVAAGFTFERMVAEMAAFLARR